MLRSSIDLRNFLFLSPTTEVKSERHDEYSILDRHKKLRPIIHQIYFSSLSLIACSPPTPTSPPLTNTQMHWGEDDEDSEEEDAPTPTPISTTSTSDISNSETKKEHPSATSSVVFNGEDEDEDEDEDNGADKNNCSELSSSTTTSTTTSNNTNSGNAAAAAVAAATAASSRRQRTASVEDFYKSLDPSEEEIATYVETHGPFAGTMMASAKPLSRALRGKLEMLAAEQKRLLTQIVAQRQSTKEMPCLNEIIAVMERIPEYQKKLQWIKGSMQRTQAMSDQMRKQSLSLQEQVQNDVMKAADKKRAEQQRDAQLKAKVVANVVVEDQQHLSDDAAGDAATKGKDELL